MNALLANVPTLAGDVLVMRALAAAVIVGLHGVLVVLTARAVGDCGPAQDGRLSPMSHVDLLGLLHGILFLVPWGRSIGIDPALRGWRAIAVVIVPSIGLVAVAALAWWIRPLASAPFGDAAAIVQQTFATLAGSATVSACAHLLPIPPLLAGQAVGLRARWRAVGVVTLFTLSLMGITSWFTRPIVQAMRSIVGT
jgi:hypothetical protein